MRELFEVDQVRFQSQFPQHLEPEGPNLNILLENPVQASKRHQRFNDKNLMLAVDTMT